MRNAIVLGFLCTIACASCVMSADDGHHPGDKKGPPGGAAMAKGSIGDIAENERVRVRFDDSAYPYAAEQLEILGRSPAPAGAAEGTIEGEVTAVDATGGTITVLGIKVAVDPSTELVGIEALGDLTKGRHVQIRATPDAAGALSATRLAIRPAEIEGIVMAKVNDGDKVKIAVLGRTMVVSADTEIVKAAGAPEPKGKPHAP